MKFAACLIDLALSSAVCNNSVVITRNCTENRGAGIVLKIIRALLSSQAVDELQIQIYHDQT